MSGASDWTERHRPTSEHQLEGNDVQRRKIREWLDGWVSGQPKKKGILLVGPLVLAKRVFARHCSGYGMDSNRTQRQRYEKCCSYT